MAVALSYTHYYGLFILLGQFLFTLGTCLGRDDDGRRSRRAVTGAAVLALIGLLWLPWLPNFLAHRVQVEQAYWTKAFDWHDVVYACWAMWTGIWSQHYPPLVQGRIVLFASMAYWLFLLVFGRGGTRWYGLAPLVTFGCAVIASWEGRNIVYARYFVMVQTLVVCGVAVGIQRLPWNLSRAIAAVVWIGTLCGLCRRNDMRRERCAQMPGFPAAIAELVKVRAPGEAVITFQPEVQVDVGFYVPDREIVRLITPERPFDFFHGTAAIRDREYLSLESASQWPADRLWVVFRRHLASGEPPPQLTAP